MEPIPFSLGFPLGGIDKSTGYDDQPSGTTPSCLNVWPFQWSKGRARGGVRPGLTSVATGLTGTPLNWCVASWDGGYGIAVTTTTGTYLGELEYPGATLSWSKKITIAPGDNAIASCAVYNNILYQASTTKEKVSTCDLVDDDEGTLTVEQYPDGTNKGDIPTYCGTVYSDSGRLVFTTDYYHPHVVYQSRVDNPRDFDFASATIRDSGAAYASSGDTGKINKPIVGCISHGNDCFILGHIDGLSVIIGNMRGGGEIVRSDQEVGPLMQSAWCKTASDHTVFLSREGLYAIPGGCVRDIQCELISNQIPNDLVGIDPALGDKVSVGYDGRYQGIHIYVNKKTGTDAHYLFSLKHRSFFPMEFAGGTLDLCVPFPAMATSTKSGLLALRSGSTYQFDTASTEHIASHCYFGPIAYGTELTEGRLVRATAVLSEDAGQSVSWEVYSGQSVQEAYALSTPRFTGYPWTVSGLNDWQYPRDLGVVGFIKVSGTTTSRWCIEKIKGECYPVALQRRW